MIRSLHGFETSGAHFVRAASPARSSETTQVQRPRRITGIKISGTGSYLPELVVSNSDLAHLGCDQEWIETRTGILQRHYASENQNTSDLAVEAGRRCCQSAKVSPDSVDLIIVATTTPDYSAPTTASLVQGKLGFKHAAALDVNAGCTGFVHALITGAHFVASGLHENVLVIGAETISRKADPGDQKTVPLLADGAGAVLLTAVTDESTGDDSRKTGILNYVMGSDGEQGHLITMSENNAAPAETYLKMDGRAVFRWATQQIPKLIEQTLDAANLTAGDIDLFVLHQANLRIIDAARERMQLPSDRFFVNLDRVGNTSAASIPIAIDEARRRGQIERNSRVVLCGFGAGLNWSACVFEGIDV